MEQPSQPSSDAHSPGDAARAAQAPEAPSDAFKAVGVHLSEFRAFASHYLAAKRDAARLSFRKLVIAIALSVMAAISAVAMLVAASVILLLGAAHGIGDLFSPPKPWAGELIVSLTVLLGGMIAAWLVVRRFTGVSRARTVAKYESRNTAERRKYGHDVADGTTHVE